jgi:hypothetical protein
MQWKQKKGKGIHALRTDGEGEYVSNEFADLCEKEGIVYEVTPPYTP